MVNDHNTALSSLAQVIRWLEPLAKLVPETVKLHVEVSGAVVLIVVVLVVWLL